MCTLVKHVSILLSVLLAISTLAMIVPVTASTGTILINTKVAPSPHITIRLCESLNLYFGKVTWSGGQVDLYISTDGYASVTVPGDVRYGPTFSVSHITDTEYVSSYEWEDITYTVGNSWINGTIPETLEIAGGNYYVKAFDGATAAVAVTDTYIAISFEFPLSLSLCIEDALEGVPVNKIVGDFSGPASLTFVDIVTKLVSSCPEARDNIPVVLTVPDDLFGAPTNTFVRDSEGDESISVYYDTLSSGVYQVTTDLSLIDGLHRRQIVWRFQIPSSVPPQEVVINAHIEIPSEDPEGTGTIYILAPGMVRALFITNRELLYGNYLEDDVTSLLNRLYTEAQGFPASHSPLAVVYYVERYDPLALNWNNSNVNYNSEATANIVASAIDELIEDWDDDATQYELVCYPLNCVEAPVSQPEYLLIIGDDDIIPFYRYNDPTDDEGIDLRCCCLPCNAPGCTRPGWCVDSNPPPNVNPHVYATDMDYILTDNIYADRYGGTDWQTGDIELFVGRLLGETAEDMLRLLEEGVSINNGRKGGVVVASVDGWELGLEPHIGIGSPDLFDVPALFRTRGFVVRNDDVPVSEVRTIDVLPLYEGGDNDWNSNFTDAANNAGGMDLFFIGGHDSYNYAVIPGDNFSPDDTPGKYTRFGLDNPIVIIPGCHGGLPVQDGGGLNGGADNDMVYDLIHEGASAYIGATGFSYGSPGNLHNCVFAEEMFQDFFNETLSQSGTIAMPIGMAMAKAKNNYVCWGATDHKTVTEFNIYGVPWKSIFYPTGFTIIPAVGWPIYRDFIATIHRPPFRISDNVYSRIVELDIVNYEVVNETYDDIDYDLFFITGGDLAIVDGAPILPYVKGYRMVLPFSGTVTDVQVVNSTSSYIGTYNIPIARVEPFTDGGLKYTTETDVDYPYPKDENLVQYQETSEGMLLTVFPIQHNPATDETTFYSHFKIQVTYESLLTVVVTEVTTDKEMYVIGEEIITHSRIENVGDQNVSLTAALSIRDALGQVLGTQTSGEFIIPAGGSYVLPLTWIGSLDLGEYSVLVEIDSEGNYVGGSSTWILVSSSEITRLSMPTQLRKGEQGDFQVTIINYNDVPINGQIALKIRDNEGRHVSELAPQNLTVAGQSVETVTFIWTPVDVSPGIYNAIADAIFDSHTQVQQSFCVLSDIDEATCKKALAKISSLEEELKAANEKIDELEDLVSELTTRAQEELQKWQLYTYIAAGLAGLLLLILLVSIIRR
ncbi:MAG: hypothetical protein HWN68_15700 [Desulfobacterales bacterium]|nr:hypothetical protein [Desulfobacterales bacterium]